MNQNELYWIWLQAAVGQGTAIVSRLFNAFSSAEEIYGATDEDYAYIGLPKRIRDALCDKSLKRAQKHAERALRGGGWLLTPDSPDYPEPFRHLYSPPLVLYGKGKLPSFERLPVIGIVGTRECSDYGKKAAGSIAAGLAAVGCPIISGGARGVDRAAHEGTLYTGGITVAVQSCGLDVEYPAPNRRLRRDILEAGGALISEYPPGTLTTPATFQVRNRLISGLSWGVCVVEAPQPSGSLITARLARDQGKDVFAVPGEITSPLSRGSNALLRDGAIMVLSPADILCEYQTRCGNILNEEEAIKAQQAYYDYFDKVVVPVKATSSKKEKAVKKEPALTTDVVVTDQPLAALPVGVSEACQRIYAALSETPVSAEWLFEATGASLGEIFSVLTELEIYGCIRSHPGQHYSR